MEIKSKLVEAHIIRIIKGKIEFLLMQRSEREKYPLIWQMVTGKIKENENAHETVIREIKEETNLTVDKMFVVPNVNPFYDSFDNTMNLVPVFVVEVMSDSEVRISDEHQNYEWLNKKEAKRRLAWPGQSESVELIHSYYTRKKENLNFIEINI